MITLLSTLISGIAASTGLLIFVGGALAATKVVCTTVLRYQQGEHSRDERYLLMLSDHEREVAVRRLLHVPRPGEGQTVSSLPDPY